MFTFTVLVVVLRAYAFNKCIAMNPRCPRDLNNSVFFFCMGEAYNAFDSLRSFIKRECGSSLKDSLLERGNYLMNLSLRAWGKSFTLRGYCWEFSHYYSGVWGSASALVPGALCVCVLCFFCFKFSLFSFRS